MGLSSPLGSLLFILGLCGTSTGFVQENCTNYKLQFERVYSVPGDVAMLNTTLVSPDVFDFKTVPYNITWYDSKTGQEINDRTGQILVRGETLWLLNVTLEDDGEYVSVLRTPSKCYMQATKLVVDVPPAGECGRPQKAHQPLTKGVHDFLNCPLNDYINKLSSYNVTSSLTWYKGCDLILHETGSYIYRSKTKLTIKGVEFQHSGAYTCTLTFSLGGITGSVSETIMANVRDIYSLVPQIHEPANETIKAHPGSKFSQRCLVFVPGVGRPTTDVSWLVNNKFIFNFHPSDRVHVIKRSWSQDVPKTGMWIERTLVISELTEKDFNLYTCQVSSSRGCPLGYFTLLPAVPVIQPPVIVSPFNGTIYESSHGSGLEMSCLVLTECQTADSTKVTWLVNDQSVESSYLDKRALQGGRRVSRLSTDCQIEQRLVVAEITEEDVMTEIKCVVQNEGGRQEILTLLQLEDSTFTWLAVAAVAVSCFLAVVSVFLYILFKPKKEKKKDYFLARQSSTFSFS